MVELDLSGVATFLPVFGFLLVFVVVYALLSKTKAVSENKFLHLLISFAVAIIFLVSANAVKYVKTITPIFAVFVISLLFIVLLVGIIKGNIEEFFKPGFGWFLVILLIIVFVISAIIIFSDTLSKYFGPTGEFLGKPAVLAVIGIIVVTVFASWLMAKKG